MMIALFYFYATVVVVVWYPAVRHQAPWKGMIAVAICQGEEQTMSKTMAAEYVVAGSMGDLLQIVLDNIFGWQLIQRTQAHEQ